jgi:hypothetical protein
MNGGIMGRASAFLVICGLTAWTGTIGAAPDAAVASGTGRIEGCVIDAGTRQPLSGASVTVVGARLGAATKADGTYRIEALAPGTVRLQFSFIGYQTEVRTDIVVGSGAPTRVDEELVPSSVRLAPITVRPELFVEELAAPISTTTLRREEIRRFPGGFQDVVTTVTALPGVAQVTGGGRNDLLVRGGGPSENLFIIDGLEVPNINHFATQGTSGGALSFVNLDFVDRVDFSTGGFGARYGDRMSSVLELDLRPGRGDRIGGKGTVSATQFGINLEGPIGSKGTFLASARKSYLDLIFRAAGLPFIPVYTDYNLFAESSLSPRDRLSFVGLAARDRVETIRDSAKKRRTIASLLDNNQDQFAIGARLRHLIQRGYVEGVLGFDRTAFDLSQADTSVASRPFYRTEAIQRDVSLKAGFLRRLGDALDLTGGLAIKWAGTNNTTTFADSVYDRSGRRVSRESLGLPGALRVDGPTRALALWSQAERNLSPRWSLSLGMRWEDFSGVDPSTYLSPRVALAHRPTERLKLRATFGRYTQPPAAVWLANPANHLRALLCDQGVLGGEYLLREDTSVRLETYYKRYRDLPGGTRPAGGPAAETDYLVLTNTGVGFGGREDDFQSFGYIDLASRASGEAVGIEVLAQKKLSEIPCYGQLSLSIGKSGYRALNGKWYPGEYDQRAILNLSGGYVFDPRWQLGARFRLISGAPYTPVHDPRTNAMNPGSTQNLPAEYLSQRLGPTHQLDLRVDRRWNFAGWALVTFVDVQNVYNFKLPQAPTWNFADQKIEDRNTIGILPSIGITAEF